MSDSGVNGTILLDIKIGVAVILVGAIIYVGRLLYKRRRKRKDLEKALDSIVEMEEIDIVPQPKKTAADHLGELKEATQKVLQPLRKSSSFYSPKENSSLNLTNLSSESSRSSFRAKHDNKNLTLKDPLMIRPFKVPLPPPPSPLRKDDIRVDPLRLSLLNLLLTNASKNTSPIPSPVVDSPNEFSNSQSDTFPPESNYLSRTPLSQSEITFPSETNSKKDLKRETFSHSDIKYPLETNSKRDLSRHLSQPDLRHPTEKISRKDLLRTKLSQPDLRHPPETKSKRDLSQKLTQPDLRHPPETNSKRDLIRKTLSQSDLKYPTETNSKKDLLRTKLTQPDLNNPPLSQLDLTSPSKTRSKNVITISPRTVPQLDSPVPSDTHLKRDLTQTKSNLDPLIRPKRSNRYTYSFNKETNDYTNFRPIQTIIPRTVRPEKRTMAAKFAETEKAGELTLSPMYSIVKPGLKESQDDEIILDASLE